MTNNNWPQGGPGNGWSDPRNQQGAPQPAPGNNGYQGANPYGPNNNGPQSNQPFAAPRPAPQPYQVQMLNPSKTRHQRRRGPGWIALGVSTLAAALLASGATVGALQATGYVTASQPQAIEAPPAGTVETSPVVEKRGTAADWKAVNEAVGKSVVLIQVKTQNGGDTGSGVIIDKEGHIITNNHVVSGDIQQMLVTLSDGRIFKASVVGTDPTTDLAVIKLENPPTDLTLARLGTSSDLQVGQQVAAIGAPLGLQSTMTTGIISAIDRPTVVSAEGAAPTQDSRVITNSIQVDASINPGNSGGPLFDASGRVIGINSSIISIGAREMGQAGSIGLGFAIPVDLVKKISNEIIKDGHASHARLGIVTRSGGTTVNGVGRTGAVVEQIQPDSKMRASGLKKGDLILSINDKPVNGSLTLVGYVRRLSPGQKVVLQIARDGHLQQVTGETIQSDD